MSTLKLPKLPANPSREQARAWYEDVVWEFGLGFHPDSPAADYVGNDGVRIFSQEEAAQFDHNLATVWPLIGDGKDDIYDVGLYLFWRIQHGLPQREDSADGRVKLLRELQLLDANGSYEDRLAFEEGLPPLTLEVIVERLSRRVEDI